MKRSSVFAEIFNGMVCGIIAAIVVLLLLSRTARGADLIPLAPLSSQQIYGAQCPGGSCPPREIPVPPPVQPQPAPESGDSSPMIQLPAATHDAVGRIVMDSGNAGSGTLVDNENGRGIIATCAHLGSGPCTVTFRGGAKVRGEAVVDKDQQDIGAVVIERLPEGLTAVPIGESTPPAGAWVLACGYGGGPYAAQPNRVLRLHQFRGGESLEMQGQFRSGDSGGAIFDAAGSLVGIINASSRPGTPSQENIATTCRPLRGFIARVRARFGFKGRQPAQPGQHQPAPQQPDGAGCRCDSEAVLGKLDELIAGQKKTNDQLQAAGQGLQKEQAAAAEERTGLRGKLDDLKEKIGQKLDEKFGGVATKDDVVAVSIESEKKEQTWRERIVETITERAPSAGWTIGKVVAGALGLSTPVSLAIMFAGWIAGRRIKKKVAARAGDSSPAGGPPAGSDGTEAEDEAASTQSASADPAASARIAELRAKLDLCQTQLGTCQGQLAAAREPQLPFRRKPSPGGPTDEGVKTEPTKDSEPEPTPGIRLTNIPTPPADYAQAWWHACDRGDVANAVAEYNAYLQTLDELKQGILEVPGANGKQIAEEIERYVLKEFRTHAVQAVAQRDRNTYHKALYAYCVKRWLRALKEGEFTGAAGVTRRPEIAEAIEAHVDQLFFGQ